MAKIHTLKITNFRGIAEFHQVFSSNFVCLIGRGDSGKSTILEAISYVLSPQWNLSFQDNDFTNCNLDKPIEIEATLVDLPTKLLQEDKFGLYIRGVKGADIFDEIEDSQVAALTIKLIVKKDLEPQWFVFNERQGATRISAGDRAKLDVFMVSDYVDRHFSWNKGNPLYSLLNQDETEESDDEDVVLNALRGAKTSIDKHPFSELAGALAKVVVSAKSLGIDISKVSNTIDFKDLFMKDGRVSLHDRKVPFRLKGKGSKRLISIAIQTALAESGGIMLIDEIEQGLEPDRAQHLVSTLKSSNKGQIFLTTHSRDVLVELETADLFLMKNGATKFGVFDNSMQGLLRKNPESFFANKIMVCEGATEIGICRAINTFKIAKGQNNAAHEGIRFADGTGNEAIAYTKGFNTAGYSTTLFCDSDLDKKNKIISTQKAGLKASGIGIIDWNEGDCLEIAILKDLTLQGAIDVLELTAVLKNQASDTSIEDSKIGIWQAISSAYGVGCPASLTKDTDCPKLRVAIGKAAGNGKWFKSMGKGEQLGNVVFKHWNDLPADSVLKIQMIALSKFIDGNGL